MGTKPGKVEKYLIEKIREDGAIHISLLDPEDVDEATLPELTADLKDGGTDAIMVGGSTLADPLRMGFFIERLKSEIDLPVIIFPNNVSSVVPQADAIWFMTLLNSTNPYYIIGAQMLAAPMIRRYGLEAIPMGYLVMGEGRTVGFVGDAKPIPYDKPEITVAYALAAHYLGMRFVYLEAGSGASRPIPSNVVSAVKKATPELILVVGGGIRSPNDAQMLIRAGCDIIVTGTILESRDDRSKLKQMISSIKEAGRGRLKG